MYNLADAKVYRQNAGKITIAAALVGLAVFVFVFLLNTGRTELMKVEAQQYATTTLTVLNTPPVWIASTTELIESSVTNPTNSGDLISWTAVATDPNQPNYYLLICSTAAAPSSTNGGAPRCNGGVQWGVSSPTPVGTAAIVSTTTTEVAPFATTSNWYGWICDNDAVFARCNNTFTQGTNATNSSPFIINLRPVFSNFFSDSPKAPGQQINFSSTSTDPDGNTMTLIVCSTSAYSTTTNTCGATTLATTTVPVTANAGAVYTLPNVIRDNAYDAYGFLIDQFGHRAQGGAQATNSPITVLNVPPSVPSGQISINGGANIVVSNPGTETSGFTLSFAVSDANSCSNVSAVAGSEITGYFVSFFRGSLGTTSCSGFDPDDHNPNNCYTSAIATTTWALGCTASSTTCTPDGIDDTIVYNCTFPMWHLADPTNDVNSPFNGDHWTAAVAGIDDDNATGTQATSTNRAMLNSFAYFELQQSQIPYGQLEPGDVTPFLTASTTIATLGNTGLDQLLSGAAMCGTYSPGNPCPSSASSTIPEDRQQFATSSVAYGSGTTLSSTTIKELELNVPKSTSTTTPASRPIHWGIGVPSSITLAGSYTGMNTFQLVVSENNW